MSIESGGYVPPEADQKKEPIVENKPVTEQTDWRKNMQQGLEIPPGESSGPVPVGGPENKEGLPWKERQPLDPPTPLINHPGTTTPTDQTGDSTSVSPVITPTEMSGNIASVPPDDSTTDFSMNSQQHDTKTQGDTVAQQKPALEHDELEKGPTTEPSKSISSDLPQEKGDMDEINYLKSMYFDDVSQNSQYPDTIDKKIVETKWEKLSPEETAKARDEFDTKKADLIKSWEEKNNIQWPIYDKDVFSENGRLIRPSGSKFDAHHIQPLSLGGNNSPENITPLHAVAHYDKQGIHSPESPYSSIAAKLDFGG
jgi:hypothetical protein